jgi:hypothetical protein
LSSYLEALGAAQTVGSNADVTFASGKNVGTDFEFTGPGQDIVINNPGLYLIEWSLNMAFGNPASLVGLYENGAAGSISGDSAAAGNFSSGTLINVSTVPYTLSLRNFTGASITLEDVTGGANSAASVRILKFADGPTV